jgi:heme-degrading monooxygenase HmoA
LKVVIFRNRLRDDAEGYGETAVAMAALVAEQPGFVDVKTFTAEDGERVTLGYFEDLVSLERWGRVPEHQRAQERGREEFYSGFDLEVCDVLRTTRFRLKG